MISMNGKQRINIAPFSYAEQQYLMYLHYWEGRFRVGVGVDVNKTGSIFRCRICTNFPTVLMGGSKILQGRTNQQNTGSNIAKLLLHMRFLFLPFTLS